MTDPDELERFLAEARVAPTVFDLRPDYRALLIAVDGLEPGTGGSEIVADVLTRAETTARATVAGREVQEVPQVASWREAYRAFGAKPQRTRNSLEALLRRVETGLPRVNPLTDLYNAISLLHLLPLGGEDLCRYRGAPQLMRATGTEPFDTAAGGEQVIEHPEPGEVVWCDDAGVTCRRWNWRQARRTQLRDDTTAALFILDALHPVTDPDLAAAADELTGHLGHLGSHVRTVRRLLTSSDVDEPSGGSPS